MRNTIMAACLAAIVAAQGCSQGGDAPARGIDRSPDALVAYVKEHDVRLARVGRSLVLEQKGYRVVDDLVDEASPWASAKAWLPSKRGGALRLEAIDDPEVSIELAADDVTPELVDGGVVLRDVATATDAVYLASASRVEELRVLHAPSAPRSFRWRMTLGAHVREARVVGAAVEIVDRDGRVRIASEPVVAVDKKGIERAARVAIVGSALDVSIDLEGLAFPVVLDPAWGSAPAPSTARSGHTATTFGTFKVLVVGSDASAEIYDGPTNAWSKAPNAATAHAFHTATLVGSRILVAGGQGTAVAEIYDIATNGWSSAKTMSSPRRNHAAIALDANRVLVVGGYASDPTTALSTAEIWDATTNTWKLAASPKVARTAGHVLVELGGKMVLAGGVVSTVPSRDVELYDPASDTWTSAPPMTRARAFAAAVPLGGGKLLVAGGSDEGDAEVFDGSAWRVIAPMRANRANATATQLAEGRILFVGGTSSSGALASAEVFDPVLERWHGAGSMAIARTGHAAAFVGNGRVLVIGGTSSEGGRALQTAELWTPLSAGLACTGGGECASGACTNGRCCAAGECDTALHGCGPSTPCPTGFVCRASGECVRTSTSTPPPTSGSSRSSSSGCGCSCRNQCNDTSCAKSTKQMTFGACDCCKNCSFTQHEADAYTFVSLLAWPALVLLRRRGRRKN